MHFEAFSQNFPLVMPGQKAPSAVSRHRHPGIHQFSSKMDRRIKSGDDIVQDDRAASAGLTMRQRNSAFWIDPQCLCKTTAWIAPAR